MYTTEQIAGTDKQIAPTGPDQSLDNAEIKRLQFKNHLWEKYSKRWAFYLSAYEGGEEFLTRDNVFKHSRENTEDFDDRLRRIHNMNYCEPLVDFFTNFIFSEAIDRNGASNKDWYDKFILDVNKRGDTIDAFMRTVSDDAQVFGMSYILVDSPSFDPNALPTKLDQQNAGIRPYWCIIRPDEVVDWTQDDFGVYTYAKRLEVIHRQGSKIEHYTEFYPDKSVISEIDMTKPGQPMLLPKKVVANPLGVVPLVVTHYKRSKIDPCMGLSFLRDFAGNNREILNLTSLLQEFLYRQAFNILSMEMDSSIPIKDQSDGQIGTSNVLNYPKGAKTPEYLTPPSDPAQFIQDERGRIKNEMFARAAQDALNELFNGEKSSGFSQAQSFSKTVPFISSRADMLELTEVSLMKLTMKWVNKEWDGKIKYKDRYELTNLSDALTQFQILARDLQIDSETFVKSQLKRLMHEFDSKLPPEVVAKMDKEIDDMPFTTWLETQKEALVGVAKPQGNSPGEQQKPKGTGTMAEVAAEGTQGAPAATKKPKK